MNRPSIYLLCGALALAGCNRPPETTQEIPAKPLTPEVEPAVTFDAEKGLLLSEDVLKAQGIEFTTVKSRELVPTIEAKGQVYRAASEATTRQGREKKGFAYVTASVDLALAGLIKVGQPVIIESDMERGTVWRMERMQSEMTGKVEVLIEVPDPKSKLAVGGFVPITFNSATAAVRGLVIPSSALLKTATGYFVYRQSGKYLLRQPVSVGMNSSSDVEIIQGLREGETIVSKPVQTLYLIELRAASGGGEE